LASLGTTKADHLLDRYNLVMPEDPFYWHYRCDASGGLLTRIPQAISDEKAADIHQQHIIAKFPCRFCVKEHEGYLERSKFGEP